MKSSIVFHSEKELPLLSAQFVTEVLHHQKDIVHFCVFKSASIQSVLDFWHKSKKSLSTEILNTLLQFYLSKTALNLTCKQ